MENILTLAQNGQEQLVMMMLACPDMRDQLVQSNEIKLGNVIITSGETNGIYVKPENILSFPKEGWEKMVTFIWEIFLPDFQSKAYYAKDTTIRLNFKVGWVDIEIFQDSFSQYYQVGADGLNSTKKHRRWWWNQAMKKEAERLGYNPKVFIKSMVLAQKHCNWVDEHFYTISENSVKNNILPIIKTMQNTYCSLWDSIENVESWGELKSIFYRWELHDFIHNPHNVSLPHSIPRWSDFGTFIRVLDQSDLLIDLWKSRNGSLKEIFCNNIKHEQIKKHKINGKII